MNSKEIVICALERKIPDRVPTFELAIDSHVINAILPGADIFDFTEKMGLDAVLTKLVINKEKIETGVYRNEKGLVVKETEEEYMIPINTVIKDDNDVKKFYFPAITALHRFKHVEQTIKRFKGKNAIVIVLRDGFSEARELHGFEETLIDMIDRPMLIRKIIEKSVDYYSEIGKRAAQMGAEIAVMGDDYSSTHGMLMSREQFKEIIFPPMRRLYKNLHDYGLYVIKHSDGNLYPILDLLIDAGIDCLNPIDPLGGMSLAKVKKEYGNRVCIMGNVNCAGNLVHGTEKQVIEEVKSCIETGAPGGGYIISSSNSIHRSVKPDNYAAMLKAIKQYGKYC